MSLLQVGLILPKFYYFAFFDTVWTHDMSCKIGHVILQEQYKTSHIAVQTQSQGMQNNVTTSVKFDQLVSCKKAY